ncbi:unnamed protein product, partial [Allacma fusca]
MRSGSPSGRLTQKVPWDK